MNTPSGKHQASSGSFEVLTLGLMLGNGSGTDFSSGSSGRVVEGPRNMQSM